MSGPLRPERLPAIVRPKPDETLIGLVVRLAEANFLPTTDWIMQDAGQTPAKAQCAATRLGRLSRIAGLSERHLSALAYPSPAPGVRRVGRADVPERALSFARRRFCPSCLRTSAHHRRHWDVSFVRACPDHGTSLLESCRCGRPVTWSDPSMVDCRWCGADLRRLTAPEAEERETAFSGFLRATIRGRGPERRLLEPFADQGLPHLLGVFDLLGRFDLDLVLAQAERGASPEEARLCGFEAMVGFPWRFRAMLADLDSNRLAGRVWPYPGVMDLRRALIGRPRNEIYAALWQEVDEFLEDVAPRRTENAFRFGGRRQGRGGAIARDGKGARARRAGESPKR